MRNRVTRHLLLPMLAIGITLATITPAHAQYRQTQSSGGVNATLTVSFGSEPHWSRVSGSRVQVVHVDERPDYDMFRWGNRYYIFQDDRWYTSRRPNGRFIQIAERRVPMEISRVPRNNWRNYPDQWNDRSRDPRRGLDNGRNNGNGNGNGFGHERGRGNGNGRK